MQQTQKDKGKKQDKETNDRGEKVAKHSGPQKVAISSYTHVLYNYCTCLLLKHFVCV